jgi:hypothetical protein
MRSLATTTNTGEEYQERGGRSRERAAANDEEEMSNTNFESHSDVACKRQEKSREQNREIAKKTRLRKKSMIEGLQHRLRQLQSDGIQLERILEEKNVANILIGFGSSGPSDSSQSGYVDVALKGDIIAQLHHQVSFTISVMAWLFIILKNNS